MIKFDETTGKKMKSWIISILIVLNILAFIIIVTTLYFRIDMTEGQTYSVSRATSDLLQKIEPQNPMIIEYYYSDKCKEVAWMAQIVQYVTDMLKEYENSGKGKVNVLIKQLNYEKDKDEIDNLEKQGIQPFQLRQREEAESKTFLGYSGIILKYKNNQKVIPVVYQDVGFEYTLDTEIKKIVETEGNKVGIIVASEGKSLESDYKTIFQYLSNDYTSVERIYTGDKIQNEVGVLVVIGGNNLTDKDIFNIDQFLMSGGKAFIALNGIRVMFSQYGINAIPNDSKLFDLLSSYGIKVNKDLVGDNESFNSIPQQQGFLIQEYRYPVWPKIKKENFSQSNPIVQDLRTLNLFWPSSIDIDDKIKSNSEVLFHTTKDSWDQTKDYQVDLQAYMYPVQQGSKEFNLAYSYKGKLTSYFANKEIPADVKKDSDFKGSIINSGDTQIVVVANETLFDNNFMQDNEKTFFLNAVDSISKDYSLIQIRNKGKFTRPLDKGLKQTMDLKSNFIIVFSTFIIPVIILILAIVLFILRRMKNNEIKAYYKGKSKKK